jgi:hypothetical protein
MFDLQLQQKKLHIIPPGIFPREWQNLYQTDVLYKVTQGTKLLPADILLDTDRSTKAKHIFVAGTVWDLGVLLLFFSSVRTIHMH